MVRDSGIAVGQIYNTATDKSILFQAPLHRNVVEVGVDPQIRALLQRKIKTAGGDPFSVGSYRDPVDHHIRFIVAPTAVKILK